MTILAIVGLAALFAVVGATRASNSSNDRVTAANVAQGDIELVHSLASPANTAYSRVIGNETYSVTRTVTSPSPSATCSPGQEMTIKVVVSWPNAASRNIAVSSVLAC